MLSGANAKKEIDRIVSSEKERVSHLDLGKPHVILESIIGFFSSVCYTMYILLATHGQVEQRASLKKEKARRVKNLLFSLLGGFPDILSTLQMISQIQIIIRKKGGNFFVAPDL